MYPPRYIAQSITKNGESTVLARSFNRPLRISMGIAAVKKMPEDIARNLLRDEVHTTLLAMGVPMEKVKNYNDAFLAELPKIRKMPDKEAFEHMVDVSKKSLLGLGLEKSMVDRLRFE